MSDFFIDHNAAEVQADIAHIARSIKEPMLTQVIKSARDNALRLFRGTVRGWSRNVEFDADVDVQGDSVQLIAGTTDEVYGFVNYGTRPHVIRAKRAKYLAFQTGYKAKTKPGSLQSGGGGSASGPTVFRQQVFHPGFPGRKFTEKVEQLTIEKLDADLPKAIDRLLRSRRGRNS